MSDLTLRKLIELLKVQSRVKAANLDEFMDMPLKVMIHDKFGHSTDCYLPDDYPTRTEPLGKSFPGLLTFNVTLTDKQLRNLVSRQHKPRKKLSDA